MTKHFAILVVSGTCDRGSDSFEDTQIRQHATKDGESSGGLLVELVESCARQALQVLERTGRGCRHD